MSTEGNSFVKNFALTLTAGPVFGRVLDLAECAEVMARISLGAVVGRLVFFKHLNEEVLLNGDVPLAVRREHTANTLRTLLTPALLEKALADVNHDPTFRPLSDQALLAAIELALRCCPRDDAHPLDAERNLELTHVLLSFQSALFSESFTTKSEEVGSFEALGEISQAEFVRNTLAHNVQVDTRNAMGRLHAFCHGEAGKAAVLAKTKRTLEAWFMETFGLTPTEYLVCAFMSGSPAKKLDMEDLDSWKPGHREETHWNGVAEPYRTKVRTLLGLARADAGPVVGPPTGSLSDFLYGSKRFHVHPLLGLGEVTVCVSPEMMLRKFLFGLPYLALAAAERRKGSALTDSEVRRSREVVGPLFEGYVSWLVATLLSPRKDVEVLRNVAYVSGNKTRECDLVIIWGEIAIVIELKAAVVSLQFRVTGRFEELDKMLERAAEGVMLYL